ncbi:M20 family peptidase [Anaerotruncus sp. AF02-27]|nr:M20 family peptidase [Anaerotruncus sp. AF02-27]
MENLPLRAGKRFGPQGKNFSCPCERNGACGMEKKQLRELVESKKDQLLELCQQLIRIPSVNPPGEMEAVTAFICDYLKAHGIACEILRPTPQTPNIVARMGRPGGRRLLLNGHSDVVPVGNLEKWDFDPFCGEIRDGKILGRGTSDMKCGLAGLLFVMGLLAEEKADLGGELLLTVVPDEEVSGAWGTKWLVESGAVTGDACLIAEPTGYFNCEIGQKGSCWIQLSVSGTPAHGSLSPFVGDNAIVKLMRILNRIEQIREIVPRYDDEVARVMEESRAMAKRLLTAPGAQHVLNHCSVNIGKISGGTKVNMVPDSAYAEVDVRIPLGVTSEMVEEKLLLIIKEAGVDGVEYSFGWKSEPNCTDQKAEIVEAVAQNVQEVWGEPLNRTYQWASSDARFFRYAGIPTLQYGPANLEGVHAYNETVDVQDVINAAKVYIGAITDYLG